MLYEIAVRDVPYGDEIAKSKKQKRNGYAKKLMREVASGNRQPLLDGKRVECRKYGVGGAFKKRRSFTICGIVLSRMQLIVLRLLPTVVKHCVKFEPEQRPTMQDVVRRLENLIEAAETEPVMQVSKTRSGPRRTKVAIANAKDLSSPWRASPKVSTALETFISRIEDQESRAKLEELCKQVAADLGAHRTDPLSGVYNPVRLFQFLCVAEMDVQDAVVQIVLNFNARLEFKLDAKRERIVREDLSFNTLPRMLEYIRYQPFNPFVGRAKDGRAISYLNFGDKCDFEGLGKAFSVEEYIDCGYREGRER